MNYGDKKAHISTGFFICSGVPKGNLLDRPRVAQPLQLLIKCGVFHLYFSVNYQNALCRKKLSVQAARVSSMPYEEACDKEIDVGIDLRSA